MILSDLLRNDVFDDKGQRLGRVVDVRFRLEGGTTPSQAEVIGLIVSPRSAASFLGYERSALSKPVVINSILSWMHRGSFLVDWSDVRRIDQTTVTLRGAYERRDAALPGN